MITFKQFLAEGRSQPIELKKALAWMEANALKYLNGGTYFFRGIKGEHSKTIKYANTAEGEPRKSIGGMANYYTLWMSYNPKWEDKPRRERSFIVSTSQVDAISWGKLHYVIPSDTSKIGAVGANDIWNKRVTPELRLGAFTNQTRNLFRMIGSGKEFSQEEFDTYAELASAMKSVSMDEIVDVLKEHGYMFDNEFEKYMHKMFLDNKAKNLFEVWEIVFDPKHFDFMKTDHIHGEGEFWIDGEALYIPFDKTMPDEDREALEDWAKKHAPAFGRAIS
ncbi:hypothetical protein [Acinetobacter sp.]|uniref:hypothetical protein n=1 Tax=Acinetobacter sp. TaxID=472 RepID=UPI00388F3327